MSRTLADVEAWLVFVDVTGKYHVWKDDEDEVLAREIKTGHVFYCVDRPNEQPIRGDSLGHVRYDPWRKAVDAGQPGSLTDAHNRIDELASVVSNHGYELGKLADSIAELEQTPRGPVEPANQCPPAPAKSEQPPDVAVYERTFADGAIHRIEYPDGHEMFYHATGCGPGWKRTVLHWHDRLTWDDLRRWGLYLQMHPSGESCVCRGLKEVAIGFSDESAALAAARAIARKDGWR